MAFRRPLRSTEIDICDASRSTLTHVSEVQAQVTHACLLGQVVSQLERVVSCVHWEDDRVGHG